MATDEQVSELNYLLGKADEFKRIMKLLLPLAKKCENGHCDCLSTAGVIDLIRERNDNG